MSLRATICIFAKPPRAGEVKTRLAAAVGSDCAAAIAQALLHDIIENAVRVPNTRVVLSVTKPFELSLFPEIPQWRQPEGDLGFRVESILQRALMDAPYAIALGADTPGLPPAVVEEAIDWLERADAVLGPTDDGGYYLLGLKRCPEGLLRDVRWSNPETLADTVQRLTNFGQSCAFAEPWFDVDTVQDLLRIRSLLATGSISAPRLSLAMAGWLQADKVTR